MGTGWGEHGRAGPARSGTESGSDSEYSEENDTIQLRVSKDQSGCWVEKRLDGAGVEDGRSV